MPESLRRYHLQPDGLSREMIARVLDAADRCIGKIGLERTSMSMVAREAGVSRQTLYRMFTTREQMVSALSLRQVERLLGVMTPKLLRLPTGADRLVELTMALGRGLPVSKRQSEAFTNPEFMEKTRLVIIRNPQSPVVVGETVAKLLVGVPDAERLRHPDDVEGIALLLLQNALAVRYRFGGVSDSRAHRANLRRYLLPALFTDTREDT